MKFVTFQERNRKENETFIFFLQYDNNEEMLRELHDVINASDFSEMDGDYSEFSMDCVNILSESTVRELKSVDLGHYGPLFTVCKGEFNFSTKDFWKLDSHEKAVKLDELFYSYQITKYFKKQSNDIDKEQFEKIFTAWNENESSNDVYHLILDWINNNIDKVTDKMQLELLEDIRERMETNDETSDIVDDFINGSKYEYLRKSILDD